MCTYIYSPVWYICSWNWNESRLMKPYNLQQLYISSDFLQLAQRRKSCLLLKHFRFQLASHKVRTINYICPKLPCGTTRRKACTCTYYYEIVFTYHLSYVPIHSNACMSRVTTFTFVYTQYCFGANVISDYYWSTRDDVKRFLLITIVRWPVKEGWDLSASNLKFVTYRIVIAFRSGSSIFFLSLENSILRHILTAIAYRRQRRKSIWQKGCCINLTRLLLKITINNTGLINALVCQFLLLYPMYIHAHA